MPFLATMQGRLVPPEGEHFQSFPRVRWRDEFAFAAQAGLDGIEWIFDAYGENTNPLASDTGILEMRTLSEQTGTAIRSLCADYFMDHPFLRSTERECTELIQKMRWLISRCNLLGIGRIVVPFVDKSRIETESETAEVLSILQTLLPTADSYQVELHLETSLAPERFAALLNRCAHRMLRVNYDSGNSASLGYCAAEEFAAYGHRIGSVHIKDRLHCGGTVPPGTGDADFDAVFNGLASLNYSGDYVLQIARKQPGKELEWISQNRAWLTEQLGGAARCGR
jgi:L-ribulose-5-phosphate 3-epimerase